PRSSTQWDGLPVYASRPGRISLPSQEPLRFKENDQLEEVQDQLSQGARNVQQKGSDLLAEAKQSTASSAQATGAQSFIQRAGGKPEYDAGEPKVTRWISAFTRRREVFAGRLAMVGLSAALFWEWALPNHPNILEQVSTGFNLAGFSFTPANAATLLGLLVVQNAFTALVPWSPTFSSENLKDVAKRPAGPPTASVSPLDFKRFLGISNFGGFTKANEVFNGRLAMLGFAAAVFQQLRMGGYSGPGIIAQVATFLGTDASSLFDVFPTAFGAWALTWAALAFVNGKPGSIEGEAHPLPLITAQAQALGLPHVVVDIQGPNYLTSYSEALTHLAKQHDIQAFATGDILDVCSNFMGRATAAAGLPLWTPLWGMPRPQLLAAVWEVGLQPIISCVNLRTFAPAAASNTAAPEKDRPTTDTTQRKMATKACSPATASVSSSISASLPTSSPDEVPASTQAGPLLTSCPQSNNTATPLGSVGGVGNAVSEECGCCLLQRPATLAATSGGSSAGTAADPCLPGEMVLNPASQLLGQRLTPDLHARLLLPAHEAWGVDECGEYGEFHTMVLCGPTFSHTLHWQHHVGQDLNKDYPVAYLVHDSVTLQSKHSAVNGQQPCEEQLDNEQLTRPADWKPSEGPVAHRPLRPAWSQQRDQPVRGMMWCPVVAPRKPPQAACSSQEATQPASKPGPNTSPPAKRTATEQAAEPTQPTTGTVKGKAAKAKPAPQPGRWLDRGCNAALNMQRIGESSATKTMQQRCAKASQAGRGSLACRAQAVAAPVFATTPTPSKTETVRVAVLGASGYTGAEVMRLTALHPGIRITALTGEKQAGKPFSDVFPHLATAAHVPKLVKINDVDYSQVDAIFCCLPHATTQVPITALWADCLASAACPKTWVQLKRLPGAEQEVISKLPEHLKVVDLSADFRLRDPASYAQWYGHEHAAVELQKTAVYGLTELYREQIKGARLLANPGCYPTCAQLPLYPLIKAKLVLTDDIIIDAKSGVSGAGRAAKESNLYCEIAEGINSYSVGKHRHMPEIEQGLSEAAGTVVNVSFTPHLINMSRGMQTTSYVKMAPGVSVDDLRAHLAKVYEDEFFVKVLSKDVVPHTRHVRGTNFCMMNVFEDRLQGRAVVISVIDNLVKGASGQALQNLNLMLGYPETTALQQLAMFP
ncbi:hypothetical protein QJQ45_022048, partial [Haematococcus lacustris]